jgi:pSer/pThr/pTyr-binding forkhead associated (FHA) protein
MPRSGEPVHFPPGEVVLPSRPFELEVFGEVDDLLTAGACPEGRLEIETPELRLTCLIRDSKPFLAGLLERDVYSQVPLVDLGLRARQLADAVCRLIRTDLPSVLMAAVHFTKRPALKGSTKLVDPQHVLEVLAKAKQDAALVFERGGVRTLLFLYAGKPARLYFGDPEDDPRRGALDERALLYAFAPGGPETQVEVFTSLKLEADPDADSSFRELADIARPVPAAEVFVRTADGRQVRHRPFVPPHMIIGRDPTVDLFIDNLGVSRKHARLSWERGHFLIEDLGSANGTLVNGERISRAELATDDKIQIGKFQLAIQEFSELPIGMATMMVRRPALPATEYLVGDNTVMLIERDVIIGRNAGVDVRPRGFFVQPLHARLTRSDSGRIQLTCFGKAKATVNGVEVKSSPVRVGDRVAIGRSVFEITDGPPA